MITVDEARAQLLAMAKPLSAEVIALDAAVGRVLAQPVHAERAQPPFAASAMDGYAVAQARIGEELQVIGTAQAGNGFSGIVAPGEAVRIFTGAPVPKGAQRVVLQEDVSLRADRIEINDLHPSKAHIRPSGSDFDQGFALQTGLRLSAMHVALIAAMNVNRVSVYRKADVAILPTGDELVVPGAAPRSDQIVSSNGHGLLALLSGPLAMPRLFPPIPDRMDALQAALERAASADLVVTIGGASVGDHDLVAPAIEALGGQLAFHRIAMRPGKPLMAGRLGQALVVGLPGNPVSAMVTALLFVNPLLEAMAGDKSTMPPFKPLPLAHPIAANGVREHYMRGWYDGHAVTVFGEQDSGMLTRMADANVLVRRLINASEQPEGSLVDTLSLC